MGQHWGRGVRDSLFSASTGLRTGHIQEHGLSEVTLLGAAALMPSMCAWLIAARWHVVGAENDDFATKSLTKT